MEWNEAGRVVTRKDTHLIAENKVTFPPLPRGVKEKVRKNTLAKEPKTFFSFKPVILPKTNDQKSASVFKRIEYLVNMKKPRDLDKLFRWPFMNKNYESHGSIQCVNGKVRNILCKLTMW